MVAGFFFFLVCFLYVLFPCMRSLPACTPLLYVLPSCMCSSPACAPLPLSRCAFFPHALRSSLFLLPSGPLALWPSGPLAPWPSGPLALPAGTQV